MNMIKTNFFILNLLHLRTTIFLKSEEKEVLKSIIFHKEIPLG